jgi:hypothetical protein
MENYEDRALRAFIGTSKYEWYKRAFAKYEKDGEEKFAWNWSWWAFLANGWYLIYRKAYLEGIAYIFLMTMLNNDFPIVALILGIGSGGVLPYFVYRRYKFLKLDIEEKVKDEDKRIQLFEKFGGVNQWVIWFFVFMLTLTLLSGQ